MKDALWYVLVITRREQQWMLIQLCRGGSTSLMVLALRGTCNAILVPWNYLCSVRR